LAEPENLDNVVPPNFCDKDEQMESVASEGEPNSDSDEIPSYLQSPNDLRE